MCICMYTFRNSFSIAVNEPVQSNSAHKIVFHSEIDYIISECRISLKMLLFSIKIGSRGFTFCAGIFVSKLLARKAQQSDCSAAIFKSSSPQLRWRIYKQNFECVRFVCHLHKQAQRRVFPSLCNFYPRFLKLQAKATNITCLPFKIPPLVSLASDSNEISVNFQNKDLTQLSLGF